MNHRLSRLRAHAYPGKRLDKPAASEAEHFMACPNCGAMLDVCDLGQVLEHDTPQHMAQGRRKKGPCQQNQAGAGYDARATAPRHKIGLARHKTWEALCLRVKMARPPLSSAALPLPSMRAKTGTPFPQRKVRSRSSPRIPPIHPTAIGAARIPPRRIQIRCSGSQKVFSRHKRAMYKNFGGRCGSHRNRPRINNKPLAANA